MKTYFVAGDRFLYVHYKIKGGMYNVHPMSLAAVIAANPGKRVTTDPYETHTVWPHEAWTLPEGAEFINEM